MRKLAVAALLTLLALPASADQMADPRPISWKSCSGSVTTGGTAVNALSPQVNPLRGFYLQNPDSATGQGIGATEDLYFDPTGTASTAAGTSPLLQPGQSVTIGPGTTFAQVVSINAATSGHKYICMYGQ